MVFVVGGLPADGLAGGAALARAAGHLLAAVGNGLAVTVFYVAVAPLVPALHSVWFLIHIVAAAIAGAAFNIGGLMSILYLVKKRAEDRGTRHRLPRPGCPAPGGSTCSPTGSTPSPSRCGPSPSPPARSGPSTPGAATGAGTPRRPGRWSPGSSTPATCTPAPPPAGAAAGPPSSRSSAWPRSGSTSSASTCWSPACTPTPASDHLPLVPGSRRFPRDVGTVQLDPEALALGPSDFGDGRVQASAA